MPPLGLRHHGPGQRHFEENVMVRMELRVVLATLAIFIALGGIGLSIHGSLYYLDREIWTGVIAIAIGIVGCVTMLTLWPRDLPGKTPPGHPADDVGPHEHHHHHLPTQF
ncbi:DUF2964 domain-containing protein [Paraburkholderia azotifigens]|nr:DUF2964 domain-containing protein [Paraburkholderia azotifigens]